MIDQHREVRMRGFVERMARRFPVKEYRDRDRQGREFVLFRRYLVARLFGHEVVVHHFVEPDVSRRAHNHPWAWGFSVVLAGWYADTRHTAPGFDDDRLVRRFYVAGSMRRVQRMLFHWVSAVSPGGVLDPVRARPVQGRLGVLRAGRRRPPPDP